MRKVHLKKQFNDLILPPIFAFKDLSVAIKRLCDLFLQLDGLLRFEAPQQFAASTLITAPHVDSITTQSMFMASGENSTEELKRQHQALKTTSVK